MILLNVKRRTLQRIKMETNVFLAQTKFLLQSAEADYPEITFHTTSEFKRKMVES